MKNLQYIENVKHLNKVKHFPRNQFVIIGSGTLALYKIIPENKDLDLIVDLVLYKKLKFDKNFKKIKRMGEDFYDSKDGNIEVFHKIASIGKNFSEIDKTAIKTKDGYKFISFKDLILMYKKFNRPKDIEKIKLIKNFLKRKKMETSSTYRICVIENSVIPKSFLQNYNPQKGRFINKRWGHEMYVTVSKKELRDIQKHMIHHTDGPEPWYCDGYLINNPNILIVAFGSDDGNGGKIFEFKKTDLNMLSKVKQYGISKGIPASELEF